MRPGCGRGVHPGVHESGLHLLAPVLLPRARRAQLVQNRNMKWWGYKLVGKWWFLYRTLPKSIIRQFSCHARGLVQLFVNVVYPLLYRIRFIRWMFIGLLTFVGFFFTAHAFSVINNRNAHNDVTSMSYVCIFFYCAHVGFFFLHLRTIQGFILLRIVDLMWSISHFFINFLKYLSFCSEWSILSMVSEWLWCYFWRSFKIFLSRPYISSSVRHIVQMMNFKKTISTFND